MKNAAQIAGYVLCKNHVKCEHHPSEMAYYYQHEIAWNSSLFHVNNRGKTHKYSLCTVEIVMKTARHVYGHIFASGTDYGK